VPDICSSQRSQECQQLVALTWRKSQETIPHASGFVSVLPDGFLESRGSPIVQQRPSEPQTPQGGRTNFIHCRISLLDSIARADIVQQQIGEQRHGFAMKDRIVACTRG
jgi:hypothetical protein